MRDPQTLRTAFDRARDDAALLWSGGFGLYARYFDAIARSRRPEDLVLANAEFVAGALAMPLRSIEAPAAWPTAAE